MPWPDDISDIGPQYYPGSTSGTGSIINDYYKPPPVETPPSTTGSIINDYYKPPPGGTPPSTTTQQPITVEELVAALKSGAYSDKPGGVAGYLDWLQANGLLPDDVRTAAQIQKDAWLHRGNSYGGGMGNNVAWQQYLAANPQLNAMDWAAFMNALGTPWQAGYSAEQPTLNWNPAALPEQYRNLAQNWFRGQGFKPTGSLGQYGYTQFQRPQGTPYKPLDVSAFNAIPDDRLRAWMLYLGSMGGLIPGRYERPTY